MQGGGTSPRAKAAWWSRRCDKDGVSEDDVEPEPGTAGGTSGQEAAAHSAPEISFMTLGPEVARALGCGSLTVRVNGASASAAAAQSSSGEQGAWDSGVDPRRREYRPRGVGRRIDVMSLCHRFFPRAEICATEGPFAMAKAYYEWRTTNVAWVKWLLYMAKPRS